ncbi:MAG: hypothetical protein IPO36_03625 [Anaerolineales bacterium]|nr:hypothetical protein [Anaerolineales bacterium]
MTDGHCFISYSTADALEFARKLANELEGGEHPFTSLGLINEILTPARDWDDEIVDGFVLQMHVVRDDRRQHREGSVCKDEWTWALKFKKASHPHSMPSKC